MKKLYAQLFSATMTIMAGHALASGGPDSYGYTWKTSSDPGGPVYNWVDITARPGVQTVTGLADDNSAPAMINIGFSFHYYWSDYTQMKVGSNGWLSFDNVSNIASCFPTIPTAGGVADNYLALLLSDLNFTGTGNPGTVKYWTNNVDSFIVSYTNVPYWSVSAPGWVGPNTFQMILCASDSSITYQYQTVNAFANNAACVDMTVGIENSSGTIGLQVYSDVAPASGFAIKFEYPAVVLLSIQDPYTRWNDNAENKARFIPKNTAYNVMSNFKNNGNTDVTTTLSLQADILDASSSNVYSSSGSVPVLNAGDDTTFTFSSSWTPAATGQYSFSSSISNPGDINAANNTNTTELEVVDICASSMLLNYTTNGTPTGSINWNGGAGDDGAAVYFKPPVYPYNITQLEYYIVSNISDGFTAAIYDDDGTDGGPGTLLFTQSVSAGSVTAGGWNAVTVSTPVTLTGGGFYVVWLQGGTTIFLGNETNGPHAHQNYEILDAGWATYRDNNTTDLFIRATINGYPGAPTSIFSSVQSELDVTFSNSSTGFDVISSWNFGDGNTSLANNPVHTYAAGGTYLVCLTTTNTCGSDVACDTVQVCEQPLAGFNNSAISHTVNFTDITTGTVDTWTWNFGDGGTSTLQNPSHTYSADGIYNVCLVVTDSCGYSDTICQTVTINTAFVHETSEALFTIYPNPVTDLVRLNLAGETQDARIDILDVSGKQVANYTNLSGKQIVLNVSSLASNVYFIRMTYAKGSYTTYFIKQ